MIDEIRKTDLLLEHAVMHGDEAEAERLRAKLRRLAAMGDDGECKPVWNGQNWWRKVNMQIAVLRAGKCDAELW